MNRRHLLQTALGLAAAPGLARAQTETSAPRPKVEILGEGYQFPEGPIVFPDGSVIFVEVARGTLTRHWGAGKSEVLAILGGGPNGAALGPDGAVYVCNNGGLRTFTGPDGKVRLAPEAAPDYIGGRIERVDPNTKKVEVLYYTRTGAHQLRAPNDLVFDKAGGFWFTDYGKTSEGRRDFAALYYARPDGTKVERVLGGALSLNGVALSADEKTLFVTDTLSARVWAYELSGPGVLKQEPGGGNPGRLRRTLPGELGVDGIRVTESGSLCVCCVGIGGIATIRPDGAVSHLPLPDSYVTNLAFGGRDRRDVIVTLSRSGAIGKLRWPEPGVALNFNPY